MHLKGEFVLRELMDRILAVPVGEAARTLNGMVLLNGVSRVIWELLEKGTTEEAIVAAITTRFEVTQAEAEQDTREFLCKLRQTGLLED